MAPFLLLIILFALAWVVLILPKQRELKRHNQLVASLEVGDRVMTGSGFYGTLTEVAADTVRLELAPDLEVTVARRAVASRVDDVAPSTASEDGDGAVPVEPGPDAERLGGPPPDQRGAPDDVGALGDDHEADR